MKHTLSIADIELLHRAHPETLSAGVFDKPAYDPASEEYTPSSSNTEAVNKILASSDWRTEAKTKLAKK